jgi:alkylation response protein AidB-like acyl-CoA dehydrogenase
VLGLTTPRLAAAREVVIPCRADPDTVVVTVPTAALDTTAVRGVDPDAGLSVVRLERPEVDARPLRRGAWEAAVAVGQRAVSHQIAGACRTMLDLARAHALDRVQFGRPIARFQAVRHRLADALVALESLDAALSTAADAPGPLTAALAKAIAGRASQTVGAHCQQVLAGIGFTTDHPFHRFLRRTLTLEGLFGRSDELVADLGRRLLDARRVPTLVEL